MRRVTIVLSGGLFLLAALFVGSANAQAPTASAQSKQSAEESGAAPAVLTFLTATAPHQIQFLAEFSADKKTGTFSVGWKTGQQVFQLRFSGPVGDSSAEPLSLTGLPPGGTAGFDWNFLRKHGPSPLEQEEIRKRCLAAVGPNQPCSASNFPEGLDRDAFNYLQHLYDPAWLFGLTGEVSQSSFSFLTPSTLKVTKEQHAGVSVGVRGGIIAPAFVSVVAGFSFVNSYKAAGAPTTVCTPIAESTATRCDSAVIGAPTQSTRTVASLEIRKFFSAKTAISPSIQFDIKKKTTSIDFPFYFIAGPAGTTGGIRLGWRSDRREVTALVFIGGAITALPK